MSQGVMRKPQPFTVGTRLSIPKCPDLSTSGHCVAPMDRLSKPQNLHNRMLHCSPPLQGALHCRSPRTGPPDDEEFNHGPHTSLARSIRKIALSRDGEPAHKEGAIRMSPRASLISSHGNFNNNNSRGLRQLMPDAINPPCDWISSVKSNKSPSSQAKQSPVSPSVPPRSDCTAPSTGGVYGGGRRPSLPSDPPQIAQLSQDISEAESWVREKLQDLGVQYEGFPPPEQEQSARSIQGDIRSFEVTMMKLNQMSDDLSRTETPSTATVRTQLQNLKDQWQLLKHTATNHSKEVGGTKALQEFNKKADELEMWMREKEEIPPLSLLLDDNLDKVQLSRRILDLKQEQLYYSNLQENINSLAQKLEKLGRAESRGTSNRRKHLNRMWLRLQGSLDEYQRSLQLALEGASLWQQADTVLRAMQEKKDAAGGHRDQDLRDIAGQIMMLDVSVSQVSSLHPVLASRALHRQRQVKEIWSRLQQTVRTGKSSRGTAFTRELGNSMTPDIREQSSVGKQQQSILGSQTIVSQEPNTGDCKVQIPLRPTPQTGPSSICGKLMKCREESDNSKNTCRRHSPPPDNEEDSLLSELKATSQWLQNLEQLLSEPAAMRSPELVRRDLRQVSYLEKQLKSRGVALHSAGRAIRSSVWSVDKEMQVQVREVEERLQTVQEALRRRTSDLRDTLVLSEFMKVVQMEEERRRRSTLLGGPPDPPPEPADRKDVFTPLEELQEAVEMLNDAAKERERALAATKGTTDLDRRLLALSQMIQSASALTQEVWRKMEEVEQDYMAAKKYTELRDLQEISALHQQAEAEVTGEMQAEVRRLEEQRGPLQDLCPQRSQELGRSLEETLQAWGQLQEDIQKNRTRLHRTSQLREFFLSYLGMISWTEETRSQILSDSPEDRLSPAWREGLERSIDGKMKEFEVLAGVGWKLIGEDRLLTLTIKERLEELQGMLSWVLMRWRCQKHPRIVGNKTQRTREAVEPTQAEDTQHPHESLQSDKSECPTKEDTTPTVPPPRGPVRRRYRRKALSPMLFQQPLRLSGGTDSEEGAELLEDAPRKCADGPLWLEPKVLPTGPRVEEVEEEEPLMPSPPKSFWKRCQGIIGETFGSLKRKNRLSLPVAEEVSTYLNAKESEGPDACHSLTLPRPSKKSRSFEQYTLISTNDSNSRSSLLFRSLKRKEKAQRCTVQGIMDLHSDKKPINEESTKYETSTWPPKLDRTTPQPEFGNFLNYVKNPLTKEIDAECAVSGADIKQTEVESLHSTQPISQATCPHVTLGSVLVLDLSKEASLVDNIQESLRIESVKDNGFCLFSDSGDADEIKSTEIVEPIKEDGDLQNTMNSFQSLSTKSWIEALTTSSGYCRQNIHGYGKVANTSRSQELDKLNDDFIHFQIDRLSPANVFHHLESERDGQRTDSKLDEMQYVSASSHTEDNHTSKYQNGVGTVTSTIFPKALDCVKPYNDDMNNSTYVEFVRTYNAKPNPINKPYSSPNNLPKKRTNKRVASHSFPEVLHPNQEFLEHDDKELEDIWNNAKHGQLENPIQKPPIVSLRENEGDQLTKANQETPNHKTPSGQVVMRSEPNMLVATFSLPTSVVLSTGSGVEKDQREDGSLIQEGVVSTATSKESNQMEKCQPTLGQEPHGLKNKSDGVETSITMVTRKLDYQLMEGSLEKKHILQSGGRKASSRTWGVFYAVLVRRTLCFYHDRKHSTKSPLSAPPLNLTGALCTPESDYNKKSNCFRLRLRDGSEYLFRAPTSKLLQEWVCKLHHNSGVEDKDPLRDPALVADRSPHLPSRGNLLNSCIPDLCQPVAVRGRDPAEPLLEPFSVPAGGCRADTHQARSWVSDNILESADSEFDVSLTASRRRSRSFSSVMYQRMTSFPSPPETSPSYSVTLYIDEPLTPRTRCHSFASSQIRNSSSDLKLRNKSVFRKLFWKKE
ncbi:uncharacterized protein LOC143986994 isoform X3 [Lithobates pipiens]